MNPILRAASSIVCLITFFIALSATADDSAPVFYKLTQQHGRTIIQSSTGEVIPWACYSLGPDRNIESWAWKHAPLIEAGIRLFQVPMWNLKGQYWANPLTSLDGEPLVELPDGATWHQMPAILLAKNPNARFIMRFTIVPDTKWRDANKDQYPSITGYNGGVVRDGKSILPSLASDAYLATAKQSLRDAIVWCEKQPWRDRVVGYTIFIFGEGATEVALFNEMFDDSAPMHRAFKRFVKEKYADDAALQKAWQDDSVTRDTVTIPTKAGWFDKRRAKQIKHWPDPALVRRERDYFILQKQVYHRFWREIFDVFAEVTAARPVVKGCDNFKQHMLGWLHNASFSADGPPDVMNDYNSIMLATGELGAGPLLDHPGLDMLQTPGMYYNRAMGYAWEAEGLSDSMTLRGKVNFMEADMRTWVNRDWGGKLKPVGTLINDAGVAMNEAEMRAAFGRTLAWALSRNQMFYYASVSGGNLWFHEPLITNVIKAHAEQIATVGATPWQNTRDAICLVVDDDAPIHEDFSTGYGHLAIERQLEEGLALCGVPYRIHLLSDLARDDFPDYRCYLFPNLFQIDYKTGMLLHRKVFRNGNVAIFGPATGITDGNKLSAETASRLFGLDMELIDKTASRRVILQDHGHPMSKRLPTMTISDSYGYGPLLLPKMQRLPKDAGFTSLGAGFYYYFLDRPGLFISDREKGTGSNGNKEKYSLIFTPVVPLPPEVLREAARYAGCHVWSDENLVIYASGNFLSVHTVRSGKHTIRLPGKCDVLDISTGHKVATGAEQFTLDVKAPQTYLFQLQREH